MDSFTRREKMIALQKDLLAIEENRAAGHLGYTPDELEDYLDNMIAEIENS